MNMRISQLFAYGFFISATIVSSAFGARPQQTHGSNLFADLRDTDALSSHNLPAGSARPQAPIPPSMHFESEHKLPHYSGDDLSNYYMRSLFDQQQEHSSEISSEKVKQENALKRSDIVRSFVAIESFKTSRTLILIFDLSASLPRERIRLSELQFQIPHDRYNVKTVKLFDERRVIKKGTPELERRLIGSLSINFRRMQKTLKIDCTRLLRRWYKDGDKQQNDPKEPYSDEISDLSSDISDDFFQTPVLFVYSSNNHLDLVDTVSSLQGRTRRAASPKRTQKVHRGRAAKKKNRRNNKRNKTSKAQSQASKLNQVEKPILSNYGISTINDLELYEQVQKPHMKKKKNKDVDELESWKNEQSDDVIVIEKSNKANFKSNSNKPITVKSQPFRPSSTKNLMKPTHCRRVEFEVDFEKIGWGSWIVHPKRFNAFRCEGSCRNPVSHGGKPTNHAYVQSLLSAQSFGNVVPEPCCVPTKLAPLSILYLENGVVRQGEHSDMTVIECGCR